MVGDQKSKYPAIVVRPWNQPVIYCCDRGESVLLGPTAEFQRTKNELLTITVPNTTLSDAHIFRFIQIFFSKERILSFEKQLDH